MWRNTLAYAVFLVIATVSLGQSISFVVGSGDAFVPGDGRSSGEPLGSAIVQLLVTLLLVVLFLGVVVALPRISDWALNIPYKEYWLAPEHRGETFSYLTPWFLWFGSMTLLLMFMIFRQAHLSRLGQGGEVSVLMFVLGHMVVSMVFVISMFVRFSSSEASKYVREKKRTQ